VKHRIVNVTEFKAKCLSLLDDIGQNGGRITVTKRGKPLATVGPPKQPKFKSPEGSWAGRIEIADDLESWDSSHLWDALRKTGEDI